jgi:hypothetical protein
LFGYPVVRQYKYLGGWLDNKLRVQTHLQHISRKIGYLTQQLTPIRLLKDLSLNVNLFRTFCMPLIRMGLTNSACTSEADRNKYHKAVRRSFKAFCYLPKCLPNTVVKMLLGDT